MHIIILSIYCLETDWALPVRLSKNASLQHIILFILMMTMTQECEASRMNVTRRRFLILR
jgi:hypothetical protein